jgi:hypothetical protein
MAFAERRVAEPAQAEALKPAAGMPEGWVSRTKHSGGFERADKRAGVWKPGRESRWRLGGPSPSGSGAYDFDVAPGGGYGLTFPTAREAAEYAAAELAKLDAQKAPSEAAKPAAPPASEPGMPEGWVEHPTSASREVGYRIYRRADWCVFNMRYVGKSWRWYASHGGDLKHETATAREAAEYADAQLAKLDADRVARMGADAAAQYTRGLAALDAQKAPSEAAMPTRFKVGDRVRIEDSEQFHPEARNQLATVVCAPKPGSNGYEVTPDCWHDGTVQYAFEYQLELAPAEQPAPPRPRPTWRRACREADAMLRGGR